MTDAWPADWPQQLHDGIVADNELAEAARTVASDPDQYPEET